MDHGYRKNKIWNFTAAQTIKILFSIERQKSYTLGDDEFRILDMLDEDSYDGRYFARVPEVFFKDIKNLVQVYGKHGLLEGGSEKEFKWRTS